MKLMNMYQIKKIYKLLNDFQESFWQSMQYYMLLPFAHQTLLHIGFILKLNVLGVHVVSKSVKRTNRDPIHRACE